MINKDFDINIDISPITDDDIFGVVNINTNGDVNNNIGNYLDIINMSINNSLIDQSSNTVLTLQINNQVTRYFGNSSSSNIIKSNPLISFLKNIGGRYIKISIINNNTNKTRVIYNGYITNKQDDVNYANGNQFDITCVQILGQLSTITSNGSWNDATKNYNNVFANISANSLTLDDLMGGIFNGSLLQGYDYNEVDVNGVKLPKNLWAYIDPSVDKLSLLKEIFLPYSRLIFQKENGDITITPLFINDYADSIYNIDGLNNNVANYINYSSVNNSSRLNNRVDIIYGQNTPAPLFGSGVSTDIFSSAPYINKSNQVVTTNNLLKYSDVYKTSVNLYNSGKFIMPVIETLVVDVSLLQNTVLLNSLMNTFNNNLLNSIVYSSNDNSVITLPQLYAQIYLAEINAKNYNATVSYDYKVVADSPDPLGKVITLSNLENIDYDNMIAIDTKLTMNLKDGIIYTINFAPLLSVTGVWYSL